jgi:23S rRNA pseudouridine1911/1915/1917 synthase
VPNTSEKFFLSSKLARDHSKPLREVTFVLEKEKSGQRLDALLHQKFPHRSRSHFQKSIRKGEVFVNGKVARPSLNVVWKDSILIKVEDRDDWVDPLTLPLTILMENEDLVAINKEAGQIVHPVGRSQSGTVLNAMHARHKDRGGSDSELPKVLHRLDQETSGVLVFAKGKNAGYYGQLFEQRKTKKTYLALLEGEFSKAFDCEVLMGKNEAHPVHLAQWIRPDGKKSLSHFEPLVSFKGLTFCKIRIETGRLHQIRVHAAYSGYPVYGDSLYNPQDEDIIRWTKGEKRRFRKGRPERQLLHASELKFPLINGENVILKAGLPDDFIKWGGEQLREY